MKAVVSTANAKLTGIPPNLKRIAWAVGIVFLIILAIFAIVKVRARWDEVRERKKIPFIAGGGEIPVGFDPAPLADAMFNACEGIWTMADTKAHAADDLMKLNDNQLIAVHNYWNTHLYNRNSETMYKMMKAEVNVPDIIIGGSTNPWEDLLNRLSRLNLISK